MTAPSAIPDGLGVAKVHRLDRRLVALLAVGSGATVANLYYVQPLLPELARTFHVSDGTAGLLVTIAQISYATGLILIVPLGDLVHRRALAVRLLCGCAVALALAALAPGFAVLAGALALVALASVVLQILIPLASTLAGPEERGEVVGLVMSGTLTGILLARTVSGTLTSIAGWRSPFVVAAAALLLLALALRLALPDVEPATHLPYRRLLRSVGTLIRAEAVLRRRMLYGACGFAGFTLAWTTISFVLASSPYRFSPETIGLFGLVGVVGTVGVQRLGRLADRGQGQRATGVALGVVIASWGVLALARASLAAIVIGLILIDAGVQGQNVLSQHAIYGLGPENASRVTTAWVTANYAGGAIGSATGALAWDHGGWPVVCLVGVAIAAIAGVSWLTDGSTGARLPLRAVRHRRTPGAPT